MGNAGGLRKKKRAGINHQLKRRSVIKEEEEGRRQWRTLGTPLLTGEEGKVDLSTITATGLPERKLEVSLLSER